MQEIPRDNARQIDAEDLEELADWWKSIGERPEDWDNENLLESALVTINMNDGRKQRAKYERSASRQSKVQP